MKLPKDSTDKLRWILPCFLIIFSASVPILSAQNASKLSGPILHWIHDENGAWACTPHQISPIPPNSQAPHPTQFRLFGADQARDDTGGSIWALVGGEPGRAGSMALYSPSARSTIEILPELDSDVIYDVAIHPTGKWLAWVSASGAVKAAPRQNLFNPTLLHQHNAPARRVAFSSDGRWLASAGLDGVLHLMPWSESPKEDSSRQRLLTDHTAGIESLQFSPDNRFIASGSRDAKVRVHALNPAQLVRTYDNLGLTHLAWDLDDPIPSVSVLLWNSQGLFAATLQGSLHQLSETDATFTLLHAPVNRLDQPLYSLSMDLSPSPILYLGHLGASSLIPLKDSPIPR